MELDETPLDEAIAAAPGPCTSTEDMVCLRELLRLPALYGGHCVVYRDHDQEAEGHPYLAERKVLYWSNDRIEAEQFYLNQSQDEQKQTQRTFVENPLPAHPD
jgi:hypothetical protein